MIIKTTALLTLVASASLRAGQDFFELPPIKYSETASQDEVARLASQMETGDWVMPPSDGKTFLRGVLEKLHVPVESQVLVFSKTSLQNALIDLKNPRALYFSMDTYVGWVPGGKIEIITEDENLGPVFYVLDPPSMGKEAKITRVTDTCLQCHATSRTSGVPGLFVRSVVPDENSHPILSAGTTTVTDATPLQERWGGWYVTGVSDDPHLGNRLVPETPLDRVDFPPKTSDLRDLKSHLDVEKYLQPTSDVVALLVLEHQCRTHNLITAAKMNYLRSRYFHQSFGDQKDLDSPEGMSWKTADSSAREIVSGFLFTDEIELGGEGVQGSEKFIKAFTKASVADEKGHSLRDFRLYSRIFKYRCSYMIYSKAFKGLPDLVRERVFHHLRLALSDAADNHLSQREKKTIHEILIETVPGF